jgi:hypothetical protein
MEKWLCWAAMGISGGLLVVFVLDLIIQIPFGGLNSIVNILAAVACGLVLFLSWDAFKDLR